jgi:hypothetical protein
MGMNLRKSRRRPGAVAGEYGAPPAMYLHLRTISASLTAQKWTR